MPENNQTINQTIYNPNWQLDFAFRISEAVLTILLNGSVVLVFLWMRKYTYSNLLFMLLCASHLVPGFFYYPFALTSTFFIKWPMGDIMCVFYRIVINTQYLVSIYLLLVSSIHRFLQFVKPFDSQEKITKTRVSFFVACWIVPYVYMIVVHVVFLLNGRYNYQTCLVAMPPLFVLVHQLLTAVLPSLLIILLNMFNISRLYKREHNFEARFRDRGVSRIEPQNSVGTGLSENHSVSALSRIKGTVKSASSRHSHRRNVKAALCLLAVILNTFLTQYFYFIVWPWFTYCASCIGADIFYWSARVALLCPIVNPIIIIAFHQDFQKESLKLLGAILH